MLPRQRPGPERRDRNVQLATDARDLRFRDPVDAERLDQIVDLPGRDAVDPRLLHHGQQRVLRATPRLQQGGKYVPGLIFGISSSMGPTRVSHVRVREPFRYAVRSPVRSCRSAPISPATSDSMSACESTRIPSRRTSPSCSSKSLPTNAERSILGLAIVLSSSVLSFFAEKELTERCTMALGLV